MFVLFSRHCFYDFSQTKCEHFDAYLLFIEYCNNDWPKSSGFKVNKYARTGSVVKMFTAQFRPGGALGYFLGGYVPPGTPKWHPVLEKISPRIDTPF